MMYGILSWLIKFTTRFATLVFCGYATVTEFRECLRCFLKKAPAFRTVTIIVRFNHDKVLKGFKALKQNETVQHECPEVPTHCQSSMRS